MEENARLNSSIGNSIVDADDSEEIQREATLERLKSETSAEKISELMKAVSDSDYDTLARLLDPNGLAMDVNSPDSDGLTALHHAVQAADLDMVRFLLEHDADPHAGSLCEKVQMPLFIAVQANDKPIAEALVEYKADLDITDSKGCSLLHHSINHETTDMTAFLLSKRPSLRNTIDRNGQKALHYCASEAGNVGMLDQLRVLLADEDEAGVNVKDRAGRVPVHLVVRWTATEPREEAVRLLRDKGARIDIDELPERWRDYDSLRDVS